MYDKLVAKGRVAVEGIHFDVGTDIIRAESSRALQAIGELIQQHPDLNISITAHTDNVGASDKNKLLSEARAAAVLRYLAQMGVNTAHITAIGCGDENPVAPNDTTLNRQRNRRIEIVLSQEIPHQ